ncbi:MAG: response regulator [Deltaproteobacteria bacterium]|nr:response regulator [Deltaproteobacteria bacterium]
MEDTSLNKKKILVVDDDPQVFRIISRLLSHQYQLETAGDGIEAIQKIKYYQPHLLILDLMMPGMSGLEVCKTVKKNGAEAIQILMLSAKDAQVDRRTCLEMGADDFETKPFHIASLMRKIHYMLEKAS